MQTINRFNFSPASNNEAFVSQKKFGSLPQFLPKYLRSIWQIILSEAVLVSLIASTPIDNCGVFYRRTHCPINQTIFIVVGNFLLIKIALVAISPDMLNQLDEKLLIFLTTNDILVWPRLSVSLSEYPVLVFHKTTQIR